MISRSWKYLLGGRGGNNDDFDDHEYDDNLDGDMAIMIEGNNNAFDDDFDDDDCDDHLDGEVAIMILMIMTMIITWTER